MGETGRGGEREKKREAERQQAAEDLGEESWRKRKKDVVLPKGFGNLMRTS